MELLIRRLLARSYLFDDPSAYEAGVRDAMDVLRGELTPTPLPADDQRSDLDRVAV